MLPPSSAEAWGVGFHFENDVGFSDASYSQGARLFCENCVPGSWNPLHGFHELSRESAGERFAYGLVLGQNIYTPCVTRFAGGDKVTSEELDRQKDCPALDDDRPPAAWLHGGLYVTLVQRFRRRWTGELLLGVTGPAAFGEEIQNGWHRAIGVSEVMIWDRQGSNEPAAMLTLRWDEVVPVTLWWNKRARQALFDLVVGAEGQLGNVFTRASAEGTARLGWLQEVFGLDDRRISALTGEEKGPKDPNFGLWAFARGRIYASWFNFSIDSRPIAEDPHAVDSSTFVPDLDLGGHATVYGVHAEVSWVLRGQEVEGIDTDFPAHQFWQIQLGYGW